MGAIIGLHLILGSYLPSPSKTIVRLFSVRLTNTTYLRYCFSERTSFICAKLEWMLFSDPFVGVAG